MDSIQQIPNLKSSYFYLGLVIFCFKTLIVGPFFKIYLHITREIRLIKMKKQKKTPKKQTPNASTNKMVLLYLI